MAEYFDNVGMHVYYGIARFHNSVLFRDEHALRLIIHKRKIGLRFALGGGVRRLRAQERRPSRHQKIAAA